MQHKVRYPRIERPEHLTIEEDANATSWAVSYADFLMVLVCFFVLFFSLDESSQKSMILKISASFKGKTLGSAETKTSTTSAKSIDIEKVLAKDLSALNISFTKDKNSIVIHFPENLFATGKYDLSAENLDSLKSIFTKLIEFKTHLRLYFEGHTDDQALHRQVSNIVIDNYLLGSLRAAMALKVAKSMGFAEKDMFIQTTSSHQRNSRTLSVKIEPQEGSP